MSASENKRNSPLACQEPPLKCTFPSIPLVNAQYVRRTRESSFATRSIISPVLSSERSLTTITSRFGYSCRKRVRRALQSFDLHCRRISTLSLGKTPFGLFLGATVSNLGTNCCNRAKNGDTHHGIVNYQC